MSRENIGVVKVNTIGDWEMPEFVFKVLEPKRWFHSLGVKRKSFDYTVSFYMKTKSEVKLVGAKSEWK